MKYFNFRDNTHSNQIDTIFPGWEKEKERIAVFGAHDDDPLIGAGYAMHAALKEGAQVFVVIFCKGDCGYSVPEQRDSIVQIRRDENESALCSFGISRENIVRFEYPDFSLKQFVGYHLPTGEEGTFLKIVEFIRKNKITRVLVPNGYKEHTDHTAAFEAAMYDIIQAGDAIVSDHGERQSVRSFLQYSVWADFSPEDALISNQNSLSLRANRAVWAENDVEERVQRAISKYISQGEIIEDLISSRKSRMVSDGYLELYLDFDPRPRLDYGPYTQRVKQLLTQAGEA